MESTPTTSAPEPSDDPVVEKEVWFTVPRAAELLEVPVTRIFDRIRDGRLRVRFHAEGPGGNERPLVTSDELRDRSSPTTPVDADPPTPPDSEMTAPDRNETATADVVPNASGTGATSPNAGRQAGVETNENDADSASRRAVEHALVSERAERESLERQVAELEHQTEESRTALEAERTIRQELERSLTQETVRRKQADEELARVTLQHETSEQKLSEVGDRLVQAEKDREGLKGRLDETAKRATNLEEDLARTRTTLDDAEEKIDQSLRVVYDRDVKIASLEAALSSSGQLREANREAADKLQTRITRLEDLSEDKEKEIRRLALGLGEARAEVRLLKPPEELPRGHARWLKPALPWAVAVVVAGAVFWFAYSLTTAGESLPASALAGLATLVAFGLGLFLDRFRQK